MSPLKKHEEDNLEDWLYYLKVFICLGLGLFTLVLASYFYKFSQWPIRFSPHTADWSAFGSILAGASATLAAIGTIGVLLMSIKQFKVQQAQIIEQSMRQQEFEERQQNKWDIENEILNFQKYQMHYRQFEQILTKIEQEYDIRFILKSELYRRTFINNNFSKTEFTITNDSWLYKLDKTFSELVMLSEEYCTSPTAIRMNRYIELLKSLEHSLQIDINPKPSTNKHFLRIKTFETTKLEKLLKVAEFTLDSLTELCFYNKKTDKEKSYLIHIPFSDISSINGEAFTSEFEDFFEFIILTKAAIKGSSNPASMILESLVFNNFTSEQVSKINSCPIENSELEEYKQLVWNSSLDNSEKDLLINKLDKCQTKIIEVAMLAKVTN